ncbi:hypothetical protein Adu01nite_27480 [Paractinoplanes durhamensis]|uniref:Uncharacterized protein n=1 Tax=Paractinoplanes durhamensis TaxID=113563 RepID=A0ABQ3YUZ9_9ACTN|nr:hypothetical protein Adu01nite_27480 [Actinoplanes durhamensis]
MPRWLLIVLVLAGLLWWHGVHCTDDTPAHLTTGASAGHAHTVDAGLAAGVAAHHEPAAEHGPDSAGEECQVVIKTTAGCTSAPVILTGLVRTYQVATPDIRPATVAAPPVTSGVTLIALGISRT